MGKIMTLILFVLSGVFIYQYRYRLVGFLARQNFIIAAVLKCPFLREKAMKLVFPQPQYNDERI